MFIRLNISCHNKKCTELFFWGENKYNSGQYGKKNINKELRSKSLWL